MESVISRIRKANGEELDTIRKEVLARYAVLYPNWEVSTVSIDRCEDRNEQIDRMIRILEKCKE